MAGNDDRKSRPDLSVLRMDPEQLEERRSIGWIGWVILFVALAGGGWAALHYLQPKILQPTVEVAKVRREASTETSGVLQASGYTVARQRAAVGSKIIGRVIELPIDEGDRLAAGDLIAVLDSEDLEASVAQAKAAVLEAKAQLADAEREAARARSLVEAEIAAQAELDAAETRVGVTRAQVELAEARVTSAEAQLAYTRIVAPIDGVVIEKNVEVGEMVAPGGFTSQQSTGAIVRMADPRSLEVEADVAEEYIARLRLGMPARIEVDAVPDEPYRGELRQIVPTADRQRAQVEVKVTIDNRDDRLVPDMSCTVTFLEEESESEEEAEPVLLVPASALVPAAAGPDASDDGATDDGIAAIDAGDRVWIVDAEDTVHLRAVELGEARGEERVVVSGLVAGETVVTGGHEGLQEGDAVRRAGQ